MRVILANGSFSYIQSIKSADDSGSGAMTLPRQSELVFENRGNSEMFEVSNDLKSRQLLAIFFAFVSGAAAVSTAVLPGVFHI
jgi:hypothetical protein